MEILEKVTRKFCMSMCINVHIDMYTYPHTQIN